MSRRKQLKPRHVDADDELTAPLEPGKCLFWVGESDGPGADLGWVYLRVEREREGGEGEGE